MLNFIKRIIFATYDSDRKLFKMRNRTILTLIIISVFKLVFFNNSGLTAELVAADKTEQIEIPAVEEKVKEPVSIEDVKKILNGTYSESPQPAHAAEVKQEIKGQFIVVLLTTKKAEKIDSFKDKYSKVNFKEYISPKGEKILFMGPYEGFSIAKKDLELNKGLIPEDSFITNIVN